VYVWREKTTYHQDGAVFPVFLKRINKNMCLYIYIYIYIYKYVSMYIYRERGEQEEGERRGRRSSFPKNSGRESKTS